MTDEEGAAFEGSVLATRLLGVLLTPFCLALLLWVLIYDHGPLRGVLAATGVIAGLVFIIAPKPVTRRRLAKQRSRAARRGNQQP